MSCKNLADSYVKAGNPGYSKLKTASAEQDWLLKETWECTVGGVKYPSGSSQCKNQKLTTLKEEGFLPYVNQRGYQCIHRITGKFYDTDSDGNAKIPGALEKNYEPPVVHCVAACRRARPNSETCFACITNTLIKNPEKCPELVMPRDESLLKEAVTCQACMGSAGTNTEDTMGCITGNTSHEKIWEQWGMNETQFIVMWSFIGFAIIMIITGVSIYIKEKRERKDVLTQQNTNLQGTSFYDDGGTVM